VVRTFLTRGSAAAASALIPGVRGVVLLSILFAFHGEGAGATVGLTTSYFGVTLVATAGLGVSAVFRFSRHAGPLESVANELQAQFKISAAAAVLLLVVTVTGGLIIPTVIAVDATLFRAYWFGYSASVIVLPFAATLTGLFQSRNRDAENLLLTLASAAVQVGVTYISAANGQSPLTTVLAAAFAGSLADVVAVAWRVVFLAPDRSLGIRSVARGAALLVRRPFGVFRELPGSITGALDGLILMTVFAVAGTIAAGASVIDGAIVVLVVAILRTLIVPLKQFGMAGGRIIAQRRTLGQGDGKQLLTLIATSCVILWSIAALILLIKAATPLLDLLPWPFVLLMGAQLLLEPVTGVAFAAQKILDRPAFGLRTLAILSFLGTIPALLLLSSMGVATALNVWATVFCARVLFFLLLFPRVGILRSAAKGETAGG
jgi:hypothetical protein